MNSTKRSCATAVALALFTLTGPYGHAGDSYYRWNDASGTTVNSDRPPPPGVKYDIVSTKTNRTNLEEPAEAQGSTDTGRTQSSSGAASVTPQPEKDPEICATARKNLETLNTHARIRVADDEGNYRYIGEEEKETARANAEKLISQHCE